MFGCSGTERRLRGSSRGCDGMMRERYQVARACGLCRTFLRTLALMWYKNSELL